MSGWDVALWVSALLFCAFLTVGFGRLVRSMRGEDAAEFFAFFGGIGLLIAYGIVIGPTYYLLRGLA